MRAGQIDGTFLPPQRLTEWQKLGNATVQQSRGAALMFLSFDISTPPWDDVHVRRAAAYALDKAGLVRSLLGGAGEVATSIVPPAQWGSIVSPSALRKIYASLPRYS